MPNSNDYEKMSLTDDMLRVQIFMNEILNDSVIENWLKLRKCSKCQYGPRDYNTSVCESCEITFSHFEEKIWVCECGHQEHEHLGQMGSEDLHCVWCGCSCQKYKPKGQNSPKYKYMKTVHGIWYRAESNSDMYYLGEDQQECEENAKRE